MIIFVVSDSVSLVKLYNCSELEVCVTIRGTQLIRDVDAVSTRALRRTSHPAQRKSASLPLRVVALATATQPGITRFIKIPQRLVVLL